jgi:hypothetical protein
MLVDDIKVTKDETRGQIKLHPRTTYVKPGSGELSRLQSYNGSFEAAIGQIEQEGIHKATDEPILKHNPGKNSSDDADDDSNEGTQTNGTQDGDTTDDSTNDTYGKFASKAQLTNHLHNAHGMNDAALRGTPQGLDTVHAAAHQAVQKSVGQEITEFLKAKFDPDNDGDDDSTPEGDTDHDFWTKDGQPILSAWKAAGKTPPKQS